MLNIRRLSPNDLGLVRPFSDRALVGEEAHLKISRLGFQLDYVPLSKGEWRTFLPASYADPAIITQDEGSAFFAAFEGTTYIGCAAVTTDPSGWADVIDLRVDPLFRRCGIGTALLAQCGYFAEKRGLHGLRMAVTDTNPALCRFCEHMGFVLAGLDRMIHSRSPEERLKPVLRRACALYFYLPIEKG